MNLRPSWFGSVTATVRIPVKCAPVSMPIPSDTVRGWSAASWPPAVAAEAVRTTPGQRVEHHLLMIAARHDPAVARACRPGHQAPRSPPERSSAGAMAKKAPSCRPCVPSSFSFVPPMSFSPPIAMNGWIDRGTRPLPGGPTTPAPSPDGIAPPGEPGWG
jgi:hypothetical protein